MTTLLILGSLWLYAVGVSNGADIRKYKTEGGCIKGCILWWVVWVIAMLPVLAVWWWVVPLIGGGQ